MMKINNWTNKEIVKYMNDATEELNKRIKHREIDDIADIDIDKLIKIDNITRKMITKLVIYFQCFRYLSGEY